MMKGGAATAQTKYTGIEVQTSALGGVITIAGGKTRIGINLIDYVDFLATPAKQSKGGKGLADGKAGGSYTYSAAVIMGLCEGPITSIGKVWADRTVTSLAALNLTLFTGTASQAPWSYMTTNHPTRALAYAYTAYLASPKYELGMSAVLPNHTVEVITPLSGTVSGTPDISPSDFTNLIFTDPQYGLGPFAMSSSGLALWDTYCRAQGLLFSPALESAEQISSVLDRWAQATNTWIFWSGSELKFVPLGDSTVTGHGVTYTPDLTPVYDLTPDDFLGETGSPPVTLTRTDPADAPNHLKLQVRDRADDYNTAEVEWQDQGLVDQYGRIDASQTQISEICDLTVAGTVAQLIGQRAAYIRNKYSFRLGAEFSLLEPGDIVTILSPSSGITTPRKVRITELDEDEKGSWNVSAEQFIQGLGTSTGLTVQTSDGVSIDTLVDPGNVNPPGVIEPRSDLTGGVPQIWVTASGGPNWGGCAVLLSFDNVEFAQIGLITSPSWQGTLKSTLPSHADPDTTDTLAVDLTISDGVMSTAATHADADAFRTLVMVTPTFTTTLPNSGELMSYGAVAQGVGAHDFNLTYLRRGLYGTTIGAHSTGDFFSRFDLNATTGIGNTVLVYNLPQSYVGQTLYLKFLSYNRFGAALQDVSSVVTYQYVPTGVAFGSGTGGVPSTPTGLASAPGAGQNTVSWSPNPTTDKVTSYTLYAAPGASQPFGSAVQIYNGLTTAFVHTGIGNNTTYTYFLIANNAVGQSSHTTGVNGTSSSTGVATVTSVGLSLPSIFSVTGSPVTGAGTLTGSFNTQSPNVVFSGPTSGGAAAPTFRALVGADLPAPSASTLGGILSLSPVTSQWIKSITTSGVPLTAQPATTDLSDCSVAAPTVTLKGSVTAGTPTYTIQRASQERIGRTVIFRFAVIISAIGGMTGDLLIDGLVANGGSSDAATVGGFITYLQGVTFTAGYTQLALEFSASGSTTLNVMQLGSNQTALALPISALAATTRIDGVVIYHS